MIRFVNTSKKKPYQLFIEKYNDALNLGQKNIEAISIASFNSKNNEVDSRFVNLKFIDEDRFIFFSNYDSPKSYAFSSHEQISALIYWHKANIQIRMKAKIKKTSKKYNQLYFKNRSAEKNALAISSMQSQPTPSYKNVIEKYDEVYRKKDLSKCPDYWGGFSFIPYYFEFWEGKEYRINKRTVYKEINRKWQKLLIQP